MILNNTTKTYFKTLQLVVLICLGLFRLQPVQGQIISAELLIKTWPSYWITHPKGSQREYGIYHFRKRFQLHDLPASFLIQVSADNRYRLFVNGIPVCSGPARGDLFNWCYETIDIKPYLKPGSNIIAAQVWNMGILAPIGQISNQTAFLVQGNSSTENVVNTNESWKVFQDTAYTPCSLDNEKRLNSYMAVGPGDEIDGNRFPWNWESLHYDDHDWSTAAQITHPEPQGHGTDNRWTMVPRSIPLFKEQQMILSLLTYL